MLLGACTPKAETTSTKVYTDTVAYNLLELKPTEGLVYYGSKPFSGVSKKINNLNITVETIGYTNGKKQGLFEKWFPHGLKSYSANYVDGKLDGTVETWWKNGKLRSHSNYTKGIANGIQKEWYISGAKFKELNYVDGKEQGMQKAWRENGKVYNNYEAKNGRIFGLKRANLCYELKDEVVQD
jgi:antitoxin component YwqK of YwqJK toxin-antitoxin module